MLIIRFAFNAQSKFYLNRDINLQYNHHYEYVDSQNKFNVYPKFQPFYITLLGLTLK